MEPTKELVVIVDAAADVPFTVQTWNNGGILGAGWYLLHEIKVRTWPAIAIARVADRQDYRVRVKFSGGVMCEACGAPTPVGQSCGCFDNGCQ